MEAKKRKRGKKGGGKARRSRYVGVCWHKARQMWHAQSIMVAGVQQHLGYFDDEADGARAYDAAIAAQNLNKPRNFPGDSGAKQAVKHRGNGERAKMLRKWTSRRSRYVGLTWDKLNQKWETQLQVAGVKQHLGRFDDEADGARAYDAAIAAQNLNKPRNFPGDSGAKQAVKRSANRNRVGAIPDKGKSRFLGVSRNKCSKLWQVQTMVKGKVTFIGCYDDDTAAARAYDAYVIPNNIDKNLNFPDAPAAAGHRPTKQSGTSDYRGVSWDKRTKKWRAEIYVDGKRKYLGSYSEEDAAGRAYDAAIRKYYPDEKPQQWKGYNFTAAIDESEEEKEEEEEEEGSSSSEERPCRRRRRWKTATEAPKALMDKKTFFHAILSAKVAKDAEKEARKAGRCEQ